MVTLTAIAVAIVLEAAIVAAEVVSRTRALLRALTVRRAGA